MVLLTAGPGAPRPDRAPRFYIDSADRASVEPLLATGVFSGITTNPAILVRAGLGVGNLAEVHAWAAAAGATEIFLQAWGSDVQTLTERGLRLRELGDDVVVKFPATRAGVQACAAMAAQGAATLLTAVYDSTQVLLAAAVGATYAAPYLGKMIEAGRGGLDQIERMQHALDGTGASTRLLLASVRDLASTVEAARMGVRHVTLAPSVAEQLFTDADTVAVARSFEVDATGGS